MLGIVTRLAFLVGTPIPTLLIDSNPTLLGYGLVV